MSKRYSDLGASSSKAGVHAALAAAGLEDQGRYFASLAPDPAGDPNFRSFLHCDGAGTKSIVAYLLARATGSPAWFGSLAQDALVMNLDDVACVGPAHNLMLSNLVARNARLVGDDALEAIMQGYANLAKRLTELGLPITLAGGETADCGDVVRTVLVDAVLTGRIAVSKLITPANIVPGDVIIGLASTGRATYEDAPHSGIGSNGLTLARHTLLSKASVASFPEVWDSGIAEERRYTGPYSVGDYHPALGSTVGEALLSPTRTYAPVLYAIYEKLGSRVHGVVHNTGGGQTKVLRFGSGNHYVKDRLFPVPPIFSLIQEIGSIPWREMYEVFNMGHRMEIYLPADGAASVVDTAAHFGISAQVIGTVEKSSGEMARSRNGNGVTVRSALGEFTYTMS